MKPKYQLRSAAGAYWLLQMDQSGKENIKPILMNECGAYIWKLHQKGNREKEIIEKLCEKYEIAYEEASGDVLGFLEELRLQGILE